MWSDRVGILPQMCSSIQKRMQEEPKHLRSGTNQIQRIRKNETKRQDKK